MKNLRYILIGFMALGAFGAKVGAYLAAAYDFPSSFEWIESGMIFGSFIGIVASLAVLAVVTSKSQERAPERVKR